MDPLVFGIFLGGILISSQPNSSGREAAVYSLRAGYYQGRYDKIIDPMAKELSKKYIPNKLRSFGIGASFIYRLVEDNHIEYSWNF